MKKNLGILISNEDEEKNSSPFPPRNFFLESETDPETKSMDTDDDDIDDTINNDGDCGDDGDDNDDYDGVDDED